MRPVVARSKARGPIQGRKRTVAASNPQKFLCNVVPVVWNRLPGQKLSLIVKGSGVTESIPTN